MRPASIFLIIQLSNSREEGTKQQSGQEEEEAAENES